MHTFVKMFELVNCPHPVQGSTSSMSDRCPDMAAGSVLHSLMSILCSSLTLHCTMPCCCCCGSSQLRTSCSIIGTLISCRSIGRGDSMQRSTEPRIVNSLRHASVSTTQSHVNTQPSLSYVEPRGWTTLALSHFGYTARARTQGIVRHQVWLFTPQLPLVLITPTCSRRDVQAELTLVVGCILRWFTCP